jgi:hypothetical protein
LLTKLTNDQKFADKFSAIPLTFFSRNKDASQQMQQQKILTTQNGRFLWFQLLIELITGMSNGTTSDDESRLEAIKELADGFRDYFRGNDVQLKKINDFEQTYGK